MMSRSELRVARQGLDDQAGFSLIELMIVVLIVGILIAIALPTFLGARRLSADRATQSELRTALAGALTYFAETRNWNGFDAAEAEIAEPNLTWMDGGDPPTDEISIQVNAGWELLLVGRSSSGSYFCLAQVPSSPATVRGMGSTFVAVDTIAECTGGW
jgi:type IV pilus assembly protein PilA